MIVSKRGYASHGSSLCWNESLYAQRVQAGLRRQTYSPVKKYVVLASVLHDASSDQPDLASTTQNDCTNQQQPAKGRLVPTELRG